jgi:hypothetical protein
MDHIRDKDIDIYEKDNELWVAANSGGISTFSVLGYGKNWWQLDAGVEIPNELRIVNDHGNHWLWEPAYSMPLEIYVIALRIVGGQFYKLN